MQRKWLAVITAVMLAVGICILCYPMVSNLINQQNGSYAIQEFNRKVEDLDKEQIEQELSAGHKYNQMLLFSPESAAELSSVPYEQILDFGNGIMGYIKIPKINVELPIYHGVDAQILEKGIGHMPATAFPIGGKGNHTVLTGHTGLPSARFFTDLTEMEEGEFFEVVIAGKTGLYQINQIKVVLPTETDDLISVPGEDYCTLVTCTPYGINSHRLLVRGSRIELAGNQQETAPLHFTERDKTDLRWVVLTGALLLMVAVLIWKKRKKDA